MRLIDADTLIQKIIELRKDVKMSGWDDEYDRSFLSGENDGLIEAENLAKHALTIDAVPVRHGKWKVTSCYIKCSECGECFMLIPQNFCPACGAKMEELS